MKFKLLIKYIIIKQLRMERNLCEQNEFNAYKHFCEEHKINRIIKGYIIFNTSNTTIAKANIAEQQIDILKSKDAYNNLIAIVCDLDDNKILKIKKTNDYAVIDDILSIYPIIEIHYYSHILRLSVNTGYLILLNIAKKLNMNVIED